MHVSELAIYPVKSLAQVVVQSSEIDLGGLKHDRRWMLVDSDNVMLTQRKNARMCLIQPEITESGLRLIAPGMPQVEVIIPAADRKRRVSVWNDECLSNDAGDVVATWLSDFLQTTCRLVYFPSDEVRVVDPVFAQPGDRTAFSDGFPVLLTTTASLESLNQFIQISGDAPVPMARFRPNIVISGSRAYEEDNWKRLRTGNLVLRLVKPCSRCVIPNIEYETATRTRQPGRALQLTRRRDNKMYFGQNVIIEGRGVIRTGDSIELVE